MTGAPPPAVRPGAEDNGLVTVTGSDSARFRNTLLNDLRAAVVPQGSSPEVEIARLGAAMDALRGFAPRDELEGMMAAQCVAMHHATMDALRRAMAPGIPVEVADTLRRQAAKLSRASTDLANAIDRRRGKGAHQIARVEHVTVEAGAQAVIGAVTPRAAAGGGG